MLTIFHRCVLGTAIPLAAPVSARAVDEIHVYNAEIAKVGQWTFQLHNNYAFSGRKEPEFPGGLIPNHALNGTGEWAYGITDWWEWASTRHMRSTRTAGSIRTRSRSGSCSSAPMPRSAGSSAVSISSSATPAAIL